MLGMRAARESHDTEELDLVYEFLEKKELFFYADRTSGRYCDYRNLGGNVVARFITCEI